MCQVPETQQNASLPEGALTRTTNIEKLLCAARDLPFVSILQC
jgi:hypothetical protein